jgi:ribosome-associated translation inhibitor RaiA
VQPAVDRTLPADPAVARPAVAQAAVDVNGRIVRAQAGGQTMRDAIELMADRLRTRLDRAGHGWAALRRRAASR